MIRDKFKAQLLVEGKDDQHVVWALCEKFQVPQNFSVVDCNGINNLLAQIPVRFKQSDIHTYGIVIDADSNLKSRWDSLNTLLTIQGFWVPKEIPKQGFISDKSNNKKVGVWIMPNNNLDGMLEDFIAFLVPKQDKLLPIVQSTLQSIELQGLNKYSLNHKPKALIHSWLSLQEEPGTPMGSGITKKNLSADEETCKIFLEWISTLFKS